MYNCIAGNIYSIYVDIPNNPLRDLNAYLVKGSDRNLLIDTGFNFKICRVWLERGLGELGVSMDSTDIFLTHFHADHSGLAAELAGRDTKIFISETDESFWRFFSSDVGAKNTSENYLRRGFPPEELAPSMREIRSVTTYNVEGMTTHIEDGDILEYGGHTLRAISASGHTPGHMCLLDEETDSLFLGDHVLFDITPNISPFTGYDNMLGQYLSSLAKTRELEVRLPLPAHRSIGGDFNKRIGELQAHHSQRLEETLCVLDSYGGLNAYQAASHMHWRVHGGSEWEDYPFRQRWFAVSEVEAHLDYLIGEGEVKTAPDDSGIRLYFR